MVSIAKRLNRIKIKITQRLKNLHKHAFVEILVRAISRLNTKVGIVVLF